MKRRLLTYGLGLVCTSVLLPETGLGWEKEEHRLLGDSVFASVMRQCAVNSDDTAFYLGSGSNAFGVSKTTREGASFGDRVAQQAEDDLAGYRFHERGRTILDQLRSFTTDQLAEYRSSEPLAFDTRNVVTAFLSCHLRAMRSIRSPADEGRDPAAAFDIALILEARAQGFLADAFAAGHVLSYNGGFLSSLQKRNRIEARNYHRDRGVFVINSRGDIWQTFGDGVLHWYAPSYRMVLEACRTSLKEMLVVWYASTGESLPAELTAWLASVSPGRTPDEAGTEWTAERSAVNLYEEVRLPSLMRLPMPVSATWSHRTGEKDESGIRRHHHYPQLREDGFHDPDLGNIEHNFLYPRSSVPGWMIPEPLRRSRPTEPDSLVKLDPDWASVRWIQERYAPPSYKGVLVQLGGQLTIGQNDTHTGGSIGLGYGLWDDLLLVKNVSLALTYMPSMHQARHHLLVSSAGLGIDLPGNAFVRVLHLEGGLAVGIGEDFDDVGPVFAIGLDTRVIPLKFTYAGVTLRAKYQWLYLDCPLGGPAMELILQ